MLALVVFANDNVDDIQRLSILAAASLSTNFVDHTDSTDKMVYLVHYDAVATVMQQYGDQRNDGLTVNIITHFAMFTPHHCTIRAHRCTQKNRMTREQIRLSKNRSVCK